MFKIFIYNEELIIHYLSFLSMKICIFHETNTLTHAVPLRTTGGTTLLWLFWSLLDYFDIHYHPKVWGHLEMSLFFKEEQFFP